MYLMNNRKKLNLVIIIVTSLIIFGLIIGFYSIIRPIIIQFTVDTTAQNSLIEKAINERDPSLCKNASAYYEDFGDYGNIYTDKEAYKICLASYHGKTGDFEYCLKLSDKDFKNTCSSYISWDPNDSYFCERLKKSGFYDYNFCYLRLSKIKNDKNFCNNIDTTSKYYEDCLTK